MITNKNGEKKSPLVKANSTTHTTSKGELKYSLICALIDNYTIMKGPKDTPQLSEEFSICHFAWTEVLPTQLV